MDGIGKKPESQHQSSGAEKQATGRARKQDFSKTKVNAPDLPPVFGSIADLSFCC